MKGSAVLLFLLISIFAKAQVDDKVLYIDEDNYYQLLIDNTTKVYKQDISESHVETFVFTQNEQFKFTLIISRSKAKNVTNDSLSTPNFEQTYMDNCGCEVLTVKETKISNINSVQFKIKRNENGKTLLGYTYSFVANKTMFNIVFMTYENDFLIYQNDYQKIMGTFVLNKD